MNPQRRNCCCCATVATAQEGVIERFSKYDRLAHPGLVWINCCCCETLHVLDLKVRQLEVKVETKTKDNVFVNMKIVVQFKVSDTYKAFYTLAQPDDQIRAHVCDVVRGQVPKTTLDGVFEVKDEIAREVKEALAKVMSEAGYMILTVLVIDIDPDPEVKRSMNAINANQRLRIAAVEKGEADKILQVKSAEAEAERKYLEGAGVARQRKAIMDGLRESVAAGLHGLDPGGGRQGGPRYDGYFPALRHDAGDRHPRQELRRLRAVRAGGGAQHGGPDPPGDPGGQLRQRGRHARPRRPGDGGRLGARRARGPRGEPLPRDGEHVRRHPPRPGHVSAERQPAHRISSRVGRRRPACSIQPASRRRGRDRARPTRQFNIRIRILVL